MSTPPQRSPLYEIAILAGARIAPVAGWEVVQQYPDENPEADLFAAGRGVAMADESANGKLLVAGSRASALLHRMWGMPELATGLGFTAQQSTVYRLRADQFLLLMPPGSAPDIAGQLTARLETGDQLVTVTDVTHGYSEILLIGPECATLLSRLCGLNFAGQYFPSGTVQQSSVAKTRQTIIREDRGFYPAFRLIGDRSLAVYLWQTITQAGQDLGIFPIGRETLDILG